MKKIHLNREDSHISVVFGWINRVVTLSCWLVFIIDIIFFTRTGNVLLFLIIGMYTPARYFLFDILPEKIQKRPPSLDRSIPLSIFIRYLGSSFPISQGNLLATLAGFFLACGRAIINGYSLLFFDTFTFLYQDESGTFVTLLSNKNMQNLKKSVEELNKDQSEERIKQMQKEWYQSRVSSSLNVWNFSLKRYLNKPTYYFENNEIGNSVIDSKYILEDKDAKEKS